MYENSTLAAMKRVHNESAIVHFGLLLEIYRNILSFNCSLIIVADGSFPKQAAGILYGKSAPKWLRNLPLPTIIAFRTMYSAYSDKYRPDLVDLTCNDKLDKPLKLQQVASAFYLILIGMIASVFVFVVELFSSKIKRMKHIQKVS